MNSVIDDINETVWDALADKLDMDSGHELRDISDRLRISLAGKLLNHLPPGASDPGAMERLIRYPSRAIQQDPGLRKILSQYFRVSDETFAPLVAASVGQTEAQKPVEKKAVPANPALRVKKKRTYSAEDWGTDFEEYYPDLWNALTQEYRLDTRCDPDAKGDVYHWVSRTVAGKLGFSSASGQSQIHAYILGGKV